MRQLKVMDLTVKIGGLCVCSDLSFSITGGERWGLLGCNGIGKTTLLHTLTGLRPPAAGHILLDEVNLASLRPKARARKIGVMFQDSQDIFPLSVWEAAMNGRYAYQSFWSVYDRRDDERVAEVLTRLDLLAMADRPVDTLSGGERRRLAIASLMLQDPGIWFMDEPTNHLDLHHQIDTLELITTHIQNAAKSAVLVLHDVNLISRFCTHALLMLGDEVLHGPIAEVLNQESIERLYHHPVTVFKADGRRLYMPV